MKDGCVGLRNCVLVSVRSAPLRSACQPFRCPLQVGLQGYSTLVWLVIPRTLGQVRTSVLVEHTAPIFTYDDIGSVVFRNVGSCLQMRTASQPGRTVLMSEENCFCFCSHVFSVTFHCGMLLRCGSPSQGV